MLSPAICWVRSFLIEPDHECRIWCVQKKQPFEFLEEEISGIQILSIAGKFTVITGDNTQTIDLRHVRCRMIRCTEDLQSPSNKTRIDSNGLEMVRGDYEVWLVESGSVIDLKSLPSRRTKS